MLAVQLNLFVNVGKVELDIFIFSASLKSLDEVGRAIFVRKSKHPLTDLDHLYLIKLKSKNILNQGGGIDIIEQL